MTAFVRMHNVFVCFVVSCVFHFARSRRFTVRARGVTSAPMGLGKPMIHALINMETRCK